MNTKKPPLEKKTINAALMLIRSRGGFAYKVWGSPAQEKGIPDIICCYRGKFLAFEGKRLKTGELSRYQQFQMKRITTAGGVAIVIRTVQEVEELLDRIDEETSQSGTA